MLKDYEEQNHEMIQLIQFGYDLNQEEMRDYKWNIPSFEFYDGDCCSIKQIKKGGIFGLRGYANHSDSTVYTLLGISIGDYKMQKFHFKYGLMFEVNDRKNKIHCSTLCLRKNKKWNYDVLAYDHENSWDNLEEEVRVNLFIDAMEIIGYKREDVIDVLSGTKTAREAYMAIAPEKIKNRTWVNYRRGFFVFDKNIAIEGSFSSVKIDRFPFPFEESAILDCSKVKTSCIEFEENRRKTRLINIHANQNSIKYTDIKNAIIDEAIDLSQVDATGTKFGHHIVMNLENSIADLETMDLSLAEDEMGNRFLTDDKGTIQYDCNGNIIKIAKEDFVEKRKMNKFLEGESTIKVLANASLSIKENEQIEGIGLVRTEDLLENEKVIKYLLDGVYYNSFFSKTSFNQILENFKKEQKEKLNNLFFKIHNKEVIIRLFDFKFEQFLKFYPQDESFIFSKEEKEERRGAEVLCNNEGLLKVQLEAIFESALENNVQIELLIPMLTEQYQSEEIRNIINEVSSCYNLKNIRVGAMIENVKSAQNADVLSKNVDFICFGTNDLTEDVTGLKRDTRSLDFFELNDEVKELIKEAIYRGRTINPDIIIGFCGEHTNYIENYEFYHEMDADYISCDSSCIETAKKVFFNIEKTNKSKRLVHTLASNQDVK